MRLVPIVEELTNFPPPWEIARLFSGWPHLLFFDSAETHPQLGRYSFVSADPIEWIEIPFVAYDSPNPFAQLQQKLAVYAQDPIPQLPPFQGGLAGLFGYGLSHAVERFARPRFDEFQVPDLAVGIYDWVIAFDQLNGRAWLIARSPERFESIASELAKRERLGALRQNRALGPGIPQLDRDRLCPQFSLPLHPGVTSNFNRADYCDVVSRAVEYIHAGDCFQVNIAQRLLCAASDSPLELYGRLRERNPAPFAGYLDLGEFTIASASPERFVQLKDGRVESRPIKGTRPRGPTPAADEAAVRELAFSAKDRAENVMIVDLLRNDLGRVCEYGSVRVPQVCEVETYRYVHHLVSAVTGKLRPERSPFDLLRAAFPGGSVTGAPKVRALEIISELEPNARGPYCGCLGYVGFDGSMDMNILIRTFTIGKGWVQFPVGGGIVADSNPDREYEETLDKAAGLLASL